MRCASREQGLGFISLIYNLAIIAVIAYTAFLLGPIYLENRAVKDALENINTMNVIETGEGLPSAKTKIRNYMAEAFRMNNVTHVPLENVKVTNSGKGFEVNIAYEVQVHYIANVDANLEFENEVFVKP